MECPAYSSLGIKVSFLPLSPTSQPSTTAGQRFDYKGQEKLTDLREWEESRDLPPTEGLLKELCHGHMVCLCALHGALRELVLRNVGTELDRNQCCLFLSRGLRHGGAVARRPDRFPPSLFHALAVVWGESSRLRSSGPHWWDQGRSRVMATLCKPCDSRAAEGLGLVQVLQLACKQASEV